ncbi:uncharacterized protein MONBRDRAFT_12194 [Monosiga brevicollis MX1]|uniref:DUF1295 domain-containing protein n=1 Tax=Monosiga brevicollis TaxID=81824 RepID=A9VBI0_MONBE|nr:uncharacterized protein MONBRDRAFT_12194 [Monosiga brevicollis MX1]EDQ85065.1 predicted protein [Monosiga brevicollis MX1]|eukprot:XP_001750069.1 hypothetical protein [Monosiga brevicollis MX1]
MTGAEGGAGSAPVSSYASSMGRIVLAYLSAIGAAAAVVVGINNGHPANDDVSVLGRGLLAFAVSTFVIFLWSVTHGNTSFFDAYWSVAPPLVATYWAIQGAIDGRQPDAVRLGLFFVPMIVWAIRLTVNWAWGFPGLHHEDWRYVDMKRQMQGTLESPPRWRQIFYWICGSLLALHTFPAVEIALGTIPDFGEALFWWGLFLMGITADDASRYWWTAAGALAITLMLFFASIPMMEQRQLARRPQTYRAYMRVTPSRLVPWFPRSAEEARPLNDRE